ncbi:MAG: Rossmann-like domain-containing protein [Promethearchaeota archaeon]
MILEKTVELVSQIYRYLKILPPKVARVVIGLGYTGVEIHAYAYNPFLGLAYTLPSVIEKTNCSKINFAGKLAEKPPGKLLKWAYKAPSLEKIIGIATLNAISQHLLKIMNPHKKLKVDLVEYLKIDKDTKVVFVGQISSLIQRVNKITKYIIIIENNPSISLPLNKFSIKTNIDKLSKEEMSTDILFCTGTALINDTMEDILALFRRYAQKIVVIGPSASMIPDILFDSGVDIVGGMKIVDYESAIKVLQEGGGTKHFKQYGKKYNLIKE